MEKVYCFNQTTQGFSHIQRGTPCQDASASFADGEGRYYLAALSDGHGDPACFRSERGSKFAVETAMEILQGFAEELLAKPEPVKKRFFQDIFSEKNHGRYREIYMRNSLTDRVVDMWTARVNRDLAENPPQEEELRRFGYPSADMTHIYGATLMAALWLEPGLFLIHQGDGRCEVFFEDGSVSQPVPWDDMCEGNVTTSLCESDAKQRFRHCVLNLSETPVSACYLACDGVEDAYRDTYEDLGGSHGLMGGVHTFFRYVSCLAAQYEKKDLERILAAFLPDFSARGLFSRAGSCDDVSIAGIVRPEPLAALTEGFQVDIRRYELEDARFWKSEDLRGKMRKHDILKERVSDAGQEIARLREKERIQARNCREDKEEDDMLFAAYREAKQRREDFYEKEKSIRDSLTPSLGIGRLVSILKEMGDVFMEALQLGLQTLHGEREELVEHTLEKYAEHHEQFMNGEASLMELTKQREAAEKDAETVKAEFREYDAEFRAIERERADIDRRIQELTPEDLRRDPIRFPAPPPEERDEASTPETRGDEVKVAAPKAKQRKPVKKRSRVQRRYNWKQPLKRKKRARVPGASGKTEK
ncbi:MAG: protein phosphatase 2C domain-containing protein [Oscillibacter sp.]|nr:protein phosphatase 2C domain-containing protein [Oscillibacter sp.]